MEWGSWQITFDRPSFLLAAVLLIPVLWWFSFRSLSGLGPVRRVTALVLRSLLVLLFCAALAEIQWVRTSERVTVIYVLDQSDSIPPVKRRLMLEYVVEQVRRHRNVQRADRAGVVVFGRRAAVEFPPFDDDLPQLSHVEANLGATDATNLSAALKLASALFPEDTSKRLVLVTDGNENTGAVRQIAPGLANNGIGIDVIPIRLTSRAEIAIENVLLPQHLRRQQKFSTKIVLNNYLDSSNQDMRVRAKVRVVRISGGQEEAVGDDFEVELPPGKTVLDLEHEIDMPGIYTYKATLIPENPDDDLASQNNVATAFTHVRGKGRVLLIEDFEHPSEFDFLVARLRAMNLEVDMQSTRTLYSSLAELQAYDTVILANVPRSSGEDATSVTSFSDAQIQMLVNNTKELGAGLIMLGGERSFGAGGWANTGLEKIMPVDFQVKNAKMNAVGALVMIMHASEMAQGNYWQKVVAREALKSLGPLDYCGLLHWSNFGNDAWLWRPGLSRVGTRRQQMTQALRRMSPGDMPSFQNSMQMALVEFRKCKASVKHMIIISDGDPTPPPAGLVNQYKKDGIKITAVAIGAHGVTGTQTLADIAKSTGGNYYVVKNPKALPKIYQREARRVTRPLVKDLNNVVPNLVLAHPMTAGISGALPPLQGMVLTSVKVNPLVEVVLRSPDPPDVKNNTILAAWTYNNGRVVAFTTDAGHRWANAWNNWPHYDQFFSQLVRWTMRPAVDDSQFDVATHVRDGKVRVVVSALDRDEQFANFLGLSGAAIGPDGEPFAFPIRQVAPGRYEGEFEGKQAGSYHITIGGIGTDKPPLIVGANVPYSAEYRQQTSNIALLKELAALRPLGGQPGKLLSDDLTSAKLQTLMQANTFRRDLPRALSVRDVWPWFVFVSAVLFFADVFVRRVAIGYDLFFFWLPPIMRWFRRTESSEENQQSLERLRERKAEVSSDMAKRQVHSSVALDEIEDTSAVIAPGPAMSDQKKTTMNDPATQPENETYTDRLLKAKKAAGKRNRRDNDP